MKKQLFITIGVLLLTSCFSLYTSCKKNSNISETLTTQAYDQNINKRVADTKTYYSRDLETNARYKLTVIINTDNEITIHREVDSIGSGLDSIRTYYAFDEDVNYKITSEKVVIIDTPAIGNTYLIPFKPKHDIESYIEGGESSVTEFYCTCELAISSSPSCQADLVKLKNGSLLANCTAKNCQTCKLHARKTTKKKDKGTKISVIKDLDTNDGFIVINGNALHEI